MHTLGPGIWREIGNRGKREMHAVGPAKWQENCQTRRVINSYRRTWNMARNTEKCAK